MWASTTLKGVSVEGEKIISCMSEWQQNAVDGGYIFRLSSMDSVQLEGNRFIPSVYESRAIFPRSTYHVTKSLTVQWKV